MPKKTISVEDIKKIDEIREKLGEQELEILEQQIELLNRINIEFEKKPKINELIEKLKLELRKALEDIKSFLRYLRKEEEKYKDVMLDVGYEVIEESILSDYTKEIKEAIKLIEKLDEYHEDMPLVEGIVFKITENLEKLRKLLQESEDLLIKELKFTEEEVGLSKEDKEKKRIRVFKTVFEKMKVPVRGEF